MKLFDIIKDANSNLLRNKLRSSLTILAVFIGSFAIITNLAIKTGVDSFIDEQIDAYGGDGYIAIANKDTIDLMMGTMTNQTEVHEYDPQKNQAIASAITDTQLAGLQTIAGIDHDNLLPQHTVTVDYIASDRTDKKYLISVQAIPSENVRIKTIAGDRPNNDSDQSQIVLTTEMADALGYTDYSAAIDQVVTLGVIDHYTKNTKEFTAHIAGISAPGVISLGYNFINNTLSDQIFDENTKYYPEVEKSKTFTYTTTYDYQNYTSEEINHELEKIGLTGITIDKIIGQIRTFFDIIIAILNIFGSIALLAAAIGIINTLFMSVQERTREIGLNKALGMSSLRIYATFSLEAIFLGFWGSLIGIIVSMFCGYTANHLFHEPGALLETFPTFNLVQFTPENILTIIAIVILIAFIAGTAPAYKASRKDPITALHYE